MVATGYSNPTLTTEWIEGSKNVRLRSMRCEPDMPPDTYVPRSIESLLVISD